MGNASKKDEDLKRAFAILCLAMADLLNLPQNIIHRIFDFLESQNGEHFLKHLFIIELLITLWPLIFIIDPTLQSISSRIVI